MILTHEFKSARLNYSYTLIFESPAMQQVYDILARVAKSSTTVLLLGETGVGKEILAKEIHYLSGRQNKGNFVAVNSVGIPEDLMESILFGHLKGSFTGAHQTTDGRFVYADRGTIFLDEIGELNYAIQGKLLRVMHDKIVTRVGDTVDRLVDVRIIAATNRDLAYDTGSGRFRNDLYYRLNVIPIEIPPLRDRREDIPALTNHFLGLYCSQEGNALMFDPGVIEKLVKYNWPGNIRELENFVHRAVLLEGEPAEPKSNQQETKIKVLNVDSLDSLLDGEAVSQQTQNNGSETQNNGFDPDSATLDEIRAFYISRRLKLNLNNKKATARSLGINRGVLYRYLEELKLK